MEGGQAVNPPPADLNCYPIGVHPIGGLLTDLLLLCHDVVCAAHAAAPSLNLVVALLQSGRVCNGAGDLTVPHHRHGERVAGGAEDGLQGGGGGHRVQVVNWDNCSRSAVAQVVVNASLKTVHKGDANTLPEFRTLNSGR